jgi:hypothetical protein
VKQQNFHESLLGLAIFCLLLCSAALYLMGVFHTP